MCIRDREHLELLVADAGKERGVGDLEAVEVQDRQHRTVRDLSLIHI